MTRRAATPNFVVPALFCAAAMLTGARAAHTIGHALAHPTVRAELNIAYALLRTGIAAAFAFFTIGRAAPRKPARSPVAFIACAVAMAAVVALGDPPAGTPSGVVLAGDAVAVAFCVWLLVSVTSLGRCFGVLPEARGLVTRGPYRFVRHPVYLGEIGGTLGLVIAAPTAPNALILCALVLAQAIRMQLEERALASAFPEYVSYARSVPRLVPYSPWIRRRATAETAESAV